MSESAARFDLYGMMSPNVRKVVLMLEELEVQYKTHLVRVFQGDQFTPDFRAKNPFSKVPVLIDHEADDYVLFESGAILIYLAETYGRFLAASGPMRYESLKWLFGQTSNIGPMFGQLNHFNIQSTMQGDIRDQDAEPYALQRYRKISMRLYKVLDERLATYPYLAGAEYSIADVATYHWAGYVDIHNLNWDDYPHLAQWRARIATRPAAVREAEATKRALVLSGETGLAAASPEELNRFWWRD